jgi:pyruvyl transferase EpsO
VGILIFPPLKKMKHVELMDYLPTLHGPIASLLKGRSFHYLDVPVHGNVGDLLIMLGALTFFSKNDLNPKSFSAYFNFRSASVASGDVIVFHGGGNFGDIYGPFQAFREKLIRQFPGNRVVVMPQSIHFASDEALERCIEICRAHADLHIFVRDPQSLALAKRMTEHAHLAPDMAHHLWPVASPPGVSAPSGSVLKLLRRDSEAASKSPDGCDKGFDWDDLIGPAWRFFLSQIVERGVTQAHLRLGLGALFGDWVIKAWIWQARRFVAQATEVFAKHERVESDRLHAHILSMLMSKPNRITDNSYGKNSRYISSWTGKSPLVELVDKRVDVGG